MTPMKNNTDTPHRPQRCRRQRPVGRWLALTSCLTVVMTAIVSCAKMGQPDGGWFDETPPRILATHPSDKSVNVSSKRITILFDEYIKLDNPQEKVVVSPPQQEWADIKTQGKGISVVLKDSLKPNTTYTIDFSDAISDNNEGNPLGNYTYSFSTGSTIDTLQVSGYVLEAGNLEPVKGILVGLYDSVPDAAFRQRPMLRVSRTDSRGRFVIKGIAPGNYRVFALQDMDGNYRFSQKSEKLAFDRQTVTPTFRPDIRQDTIWSDSLRISSISRTSYTRFLPDDLVLRAFTEQQTERYMLKTTRTDARHIDMFFSRGDSVMPVIKGLNFDARNAFVIESTPQKDTITYWLRDTMLVNRDTLHFEVTYRATDSLGMMVQQTDTFELIPKISHAKRVKDQENLRAKWLKEQEKRKRKGEPYETEMRPAPLAWNFVLPGTLPPDQNIDVMTETPVARIDTAAVHLYVQKDSLWYVEPFRIQRRDHRHFVIKGAWRPGMEYSIEIDSAAFTDIYGAQSVKFKQGVRVGKEDQYGTLFVEMEGMKGTPVIAQLLDSSDKVVKSVSTTDGTAEFYFLNPSKYYLRIIIDRNENGRWDTGEYDTDLQPEEVYYYPEAIECRANWDLSQHWNPHALPLYRQKPMEITKQKPEQEKKIKYQNANRARSLGIDYKEYTGGKTTAGKKSKKSEK